MYVKYFLLLILISLCFSQTSVKKVEKELDSAINLIKEKKFTDAKKVLHSPTFISSVYEHEALNYLGLCEFNLNNYVEAEKYLNRSISVRSDFPESHNNIGYIYLLTKRYDLSEKHLSKAVELFPKYAEAKKNLELLSDIKSGKLSIETVELFRNANSNEDLNDAIKTFEKILIDHPRFKEVRNNLAVSYFHKGEIDKAERLLRTTIKNHSKYSEAYNNLGYIFYAQEKYNTAIRYFLTALKLQPTYMVALHNLGDVYFDNDALKRAEKVWKTALAIQPLNKTIQDKLAMLENYEL